MPARFEFRSIFSLFEKCVIFEKSTDESSDGELTSDVQMGNGSSQSIVLGSPRLQASYPIRNGYHYQRGVPKYVHPQNRVLPKPIAGQRLRSTDNGSILQTAGTIRGQRRDDNNKEDNTDSEMMGILRKRSEMIEKENDCYHHLNLRNHRLFHSDPDIARRNGPSSYAVEETADIYGNRRFCGGGAAVRASKLKYKKKARAPDPPPTGSSLTKQFEKRPQNNHSGDERQNQKNSPCKCLNKTKAPQPPAIVIHPPPPPPLPTTVTTRTKTNTLQTSNSNGTSRSPSVTRAVECHEPKPNYEKNVHPLEKWRNYRSTGDIRLDEENEFPASRTTVFDSRKLSESQSKIPSYLPQRPDPFQKEIQAVTKKIAESKLASSDNTDTKMDKIESSNDNKKENKTVSPPKFYFADTGVFKSRNSNQKSDSTGAKFHSTASEKTTQSANVQKNCNSQNEANEKRNRDVPQECTTVDEIVPSLQRFSPGRRRFKSPSRSSTPTPLQKAEKEWEKLSKNVFHKQDDDSDIDIRLRPVPPRKPPELPKFSPSEAWQALGSDGLGSSNQSTSDDGHESVPPYKKGLASRNQTEDRPRRLSDMTFGAYENRNSDVFKHRSMSDSHWTPRQDLMDDSDVSSEDSEEAVIPRIRPNPGEISTRFSLPTVMFSNMRPIGSELKSSTPQSSYMSDNSKNKQPKKKTFKHVDTTSDQSVAPGFRRFLSKRNKYPSEEDVAVSDSNWTFGQYGLQKRGKQYSSDLILSDKKKYELLVKSNLSDFLGDILVTKANDMRNQMKSSDSGNSNFSFYSTEGQIMYLPEKGGFVKEDECSPPTKGRVYNMRRRFDANIETQRPNFGIKNSKKKSNPVDIDLGRKRDLELAKMLEDEVRKRRNKEKITIRQQLQRMKDLHSDDEEDDDFDDEAYFTEPKSREESQSPFFISGHPRHSATSEMGIKASPFRNIGGVTATDSSRLSHWQSSPALLEDNILKKVVQPMNKGRFSSSSVMSSPEPETWLQTRKVVNSWLERQRNLDAENAQKTQNPHGFGLASSSNCRLATSAGDLANDGDISSSPTPVPQKKERRKTNIYKQLMDIVRKEEKHLKKS
ncbi:uncharacterized protein LOC118191459, partial [Stegodyphus dumicola]|uniref:uncharacterized protein LOC118191459 n=1 Tax=Stegodyphus dumicola TaxID=202533 RepID=UPI0015B058B5